EVDLVVSRSGFGDVDGTIDGQVAAPTGGRVEAAEHAERHHLTAEVGVDRTADGNVRAGGVDCHVGGPAGLSIDGHIAGDVQSGHGEVVDPRPEVDGQVGDRGDRERLRGARAPVVGVRNLCAAGAGEHDEIPRAGDGHVRIIDVG